MKKITKIIIRVLFIVVIVLGLIVYWQFDNLTSVINGMKYSSEDLALQLDSNRQDLKTKLEKYISDDVEDLSSQDEKKLLDGEITVEEISEKYNLPLHVMKENDSKSEIPVQPESDTKEELPSNSDNSSEIDDAISNGVSMMYALKAKYVSKLGEVERTVYEEYTKLPEKEQNASSKKKIVMKNLDYVANLESKCDSEVANELSILESKLIDLEGDTEIVEILQDAYKNEKELKKSYYLSLYND